MIPGIDISHFNGAIDWAKVATAGVGFAYIKATEGSTFEDPRLYENKRGCKDNGIPFGYYHFMTDSDPKQQAAEFSLADPFQAPLPPMIDIELPSIHAGMVQDFLMELFSPRPNIRIPAVLYLPSSMLEEFEGLEVWPLWVAEWKAPAPRVRPWSSWTFWQWSDRGAVAGIDGEVDLNWFDGTEAEFKTWMTQKWNPPLKLPT